VGCFERWAEREQRRAERHDALMGGDDWVERLDARTPGPRWAWMLGVLPWIGSIGAAVIGADAWRRRREARSRPR
jgi:hypothetical protein